MSPDCVDGTKRKKLRQRPVATVRSGLLLTGRAVSEEEKEVLAARLPRGEGSGKGRSWNAETRKRCILTQYPIMVGAAMEGEPCLAGLCSYGEKLSKGNLDVAAVVADRKAWFERIKRRWWDAVILWVTEMQGRQVPQHHLVVIGVPLEYAEMLSEHWVEVTEKSKAGYAPARYLPSGSQNAPQGLNAFQELRVKEQMAGYMFLELASASKAVLGYTGRGWGVWGNEGEVTYFNRLGGSEWPEGDERNVAIEDVRYFWQGLAAQVSGSPGGLLRLLLGWRPCGYALLTTSWDEDVAIGRQVSEYLEVTKAAASAEGWAAWIAANWIPGVIKRAGREWQGIPESVRLTVKQEVEQETGEVRQLLLLTWKERELKSLPVLVDGKVYPDEIREAERVQVFPLDEVHQGAWIDG